jgi:hypothetical protein
MPAAMTLSATTEAPNRRVEKSLRFFRVVLVISFSLVNLGCEKCPHPRFSLTAALTVGGTSVRSAFYLTCLSKKFGKCVGHVRWDVPIIISSFISIGRFAQFPANLYVNAMICGVIDMKVTLREQDLTIS